jgi:hypothetical protein
MLGVGRALGCVVEAVERTFRVVVVEQLIDASLMRLRGANRLVQRAMNRKTSAMIRPNKAVR